MKYIKQGDYYLPTTYFVGGHCDIIEDTLYFWVSSEEFSDDEIKAVANSQVEVSFKFLCDSLLIVAHNLGINEWGDCIYTAPKSFINHLNVNPDLPFIDFSKIRKQGFIKFRGMFVNPTTQTLHSEKVTKLTGEIYTLILEMLVSQISKVINIEKDSFDSMYFEGIHDLLREYLDGYDSKQLAENPKEFMVL